MHKPGRTGKEHPGKDGHGSLFHAEQQRLNMTQLGTNVVSVAKMLKAMLNGATAKQIVALTGLNRGTVTKYVRALREAGAIHVCGFGFDSRGKMRPNIKVWKLGECEDVPFPLPDRKTRRRQRYWSDKLKVMAEGGATVIVPPKRKYNKLRAVYDKRRVEDRETPEKAVDRCANSSELAAFMLNLGR